MSKNYMSYIRRRIKLYGKPVAAGMGLGAAGGAAMGMGMADDPSSRFHRKPGKAALVGALGGGAVGGAIGGVTGVAMRQAKKMQAYGRRRQKGPQGGTRGYYHRERWDPFTGHGFGKKPSGAAGAAGSVRGVWDRAPEGVRKKMRGVAARARAGSTEHEKSTARSILEKMMREHGVKGDINDFIKHASAFRAGFLSSIC